MILVSSLRPPKICEFPIWINQAIAWSLWGEVGNTVVLFNDPILLMEHDAVYIPFKGKPPIWMIADYCGKQSDWCAIINADIILGPAWPAVESALRSSGAKAAISRRYQLPPDGRLDQAQLTDQGLDFFAARPEVWREAARFVPKQFKLGHILWDTWMLSFFVHNFKTADLTDARVVFHPQHEHRGDQSMMRSSDSYLDMVRWPSIRIGPQQAMPAPIIRTEGGGELRV